MSNYSKNYKNADLCFRLVQRKESIAMFEGESESGWKQWEVHVLRMKPTHRSSPEAGKEVLSKASTSEWGKYGFTYQSLEKAQEKMDVLAKAGSKKAIAKTNQKSKSPLGPKVTIMTTH